MACADLIDHRQEFAAAKERSRERLAEACGQDPTSPVCFGPLGQALVRTFGDQGSSIIEIDGRDKSYQAAVFIPGVGNSAETTLRHLGTLEGTFGRPFVGVVNPTFDLARGSLGGDALQTLLVSNPGLADETTRTAFRYLRRAIASLPPDQTLLLIGHSQGAAIATTVLWFLNTEERQRVDLITFGEATTFVPDDLASSSRYLNPLDPISAAANRSHLLPLPGRRLLPMLPGQHSLHSYLRAYEREQQPVHEIHELTRFEGFP